MTNTKTCALHFFKGSVDHPNLQHIRFDGPILTGVEHLLMTHNDCQIQFGSPEAAMNAHKRTGCSFVKTRPHTLNMPYMFGQAAEHTKVPINDDVHRLAYYNGWQLLIDSRTMELTLTAGAEFETDNPGDEWPVLVGDTLAGITSISWINGVYYIWFESDASLMCAIKKTSWPVVEGARKFGIKVISNAECFVCTYTNAQGQHYQGRFSTINVRPL